MASSTVFILLIIALVSVPSLSEFDLKAGLGRPFILPIGKDPDTHLFYTPVGVGTPRHKFNLVIDLGGPQLWYDCNDHYNSSSYKPILCGSKRCPGGSGCTGCNGPFKPGCTNDTCASFVTNPFADSIFTGDMGDDVLFFSNTVVSGLLSGCTNSDGFSSYILAGLPKGSKGIVGLARTQLALQAQLALSHRLPRKFSLCLPSSNKRGLGNLYIGGVPTIPHQNNVSSFLLTTPLIINPFSTAPIHGEGDPSYEYFIDVKSIKVDGNVLNFDSSVLTISNKGIGGTKISTINAFTILRSSIYKPLVRDFAKKASDKKIKRVKSIAPFGACFDFSTIRRTRTRLDVPTISLVLRGGVEWTIQGGNSLVLVNRKVACLGFVDGGKAPQTSIVIGGHQLEDNLLVFDLVSSRLSFSSSLLLHNARCNSNFKN